MLYVDCEGPGPTCLFEDDAPAWWPRPTEARLAARDAPPTFKALHVVPARSNRVLVFDGTMMHGVPRPADVYINAAGAEGADAPVPSVRRHVILFNVWDEAPPQRVPLADSERGGVDTDAEGVECACAPRGGYGIRIRIRPARRDARTRAWPGHGGSGDGCGSAMALAGSARRLLGMHIFGNRRRSSSECSVGKLHYPSASWGAYRRLRHRLEACSHHAQ